MILSTEEQRTRLWVGKPILDGWLFATAAALVAMSGRLVMQAVLGDSLPFIFAAPAIVLVALKHGAAPGLWTALLCGAWVAAPFLPPRLAPDGFSLRIGGYAIAAIAASLICGQFRRPSSTTAARSLPDTGAHHESSLIRWLEATVWAAALVPLTAFGIACWVGHGAAFADARQTVLRSNWVVAQHAERTFANAEEVASRVQELVAMPDAAVRSLESDFHQRLKDLAIGRAGVLTLSVWGPTGDLLASSRTTPVDGHLSIADRPFFQQLQRADQALLISELLRSRASDRIMFNLVTRRRNVDGSFGGAIVVALDPAYFQDFYQSLASEQAGARAFTLNTADGSLLARYPVPHEATDRIDEKSSLFQRTRPGQENGVLLFRASPGDENRLASFQRVGKYPVFASAAVGESAILASWYRFVGLLAAILFPMTAVLVYVAWIALRRTRSEQGAVFELKDEMRRRTRAEQALLQSQKLEALGQLTGGVAHDFNNLLAIVSNNVHLLKRGWAELANDRQLSAISRAVESGAKLTRQLLSFARKHAVNPEVLRLQEWLPVSADFMRATLGRQIELRLHVEDDTASIRVDPSELELALINLGLNAKHAMPDGGSLSLIARNSERTDVHGKPLVVIRATDSGTGIRPEVVDRVFEPFFTTKPPGQGSGLGLSQIYGLCVQAGGTATVHSEWGRGTVVSMYFPAADGPARVAEPVEEQAFPALKGRVLMVEDNDDLAESQARLLRSTGLDVDRASTSDQAIKALYMGGGSYDLVVSDVMMPGAMNGIQLAFRLREAKPNLPVILVTGYAERAHEAAAGGFTVMSKPVDPEELFAELRRALIK